MRLTPLHKGLIAGACLAVIGFAGWRLMAGNADGTGEPMVSVSVPRLSADEATGGHLFRTYCSSCHGANADGRMGMGPPLVHKIYEPSHHGDDAFLLAAMNGVRQHHWDFGNMPPVEGITPQAVAAIVTYVRALQRANGIE